MTERLHGMGPSKILIIEDDLSIRETLVSLFQLEGYEAVSARNGREALELLLQGDFRPDVITLDLMMPIMNGWEFLEKKDQIPAIRSIPVVAVSAAPNIRELSQVATIVPKPMEIATLLSAVARACGKK